MKTRFIRYLSLVAILVAADWITKLLFVPENTEAIHVFSATEAELRMYFVPIAIAGFIYSLMKESWFTPVRIVFSLMLAGALGNLLDASIDLQVVNFIPVVIAGYRYWTNVADLYLVVGGLILIADILVLRRLRKAE